MAIYELIEEVESYLVEAEWDHFYVWLEEELSKKYFTEEEKEIYFEDNEFYFEYFIEHNGGLDGLYRFEDLLMVLEKYNIPKNHIYIKTMQILEYCKNYVKGEY